MKKYIVDDRDVDKAKGAIIDPRPHDGFIAGSVPDAVNIFWDDFYNVDGTFKSEDDLLLLFELAGVDPFDTYLITTCGTGVSAWIPFMALMLLGNTSVEVYYGSWAEWSQLH